jgi:hypothetical protein
VSEFSAEVSPGHFETQVETFYGPDQTFTTQTVGRPLSLPDGRVWEMVSPPQKEGAQFGLVGEGITMAASTGNAFTDYTLFAATEAEPAGANWWPSTFFGRGPNGWTSKVIAPPHNRAGAVGGSGVEYRFFSEDLSKGVLQPFGNIGPLSPEASEITPYVRTDFFNGDAGQICTKQTEETTGVHCYRPLVSGCPEAGKTCAPAVEEHADVPAGTKFDVQGIRGNGLCGYTECGPEFLDATPNFEHIMIDSKGASLTKGGAEYGLYEWSAGKLTFVGTDATRGGSGLGDSERGGTAVHALSEDGSHVIFFGESEGLSGLLVRDTVTGKTLRIVGAEGGGEYKPSILVAASSNDSRIFFTEYNIFEGELYECKLVEENGAPKCIYTAIAPNVKVRVPTLSNDGSYLYFFSSAALGPGAVPGGYNLYVRRVGEKPRYIATLSGEDSPDWSGQDATTNLTVHVSSNGRYFTFMSDKNLTGYDTTDAIAKVPDEEVYLYHASEHPAVEPGKLICASCNPTGARPVGFLPSNPVETSEIPIVRIEGFPGWVASNIEPWERSSGGQEGPMLYQPRSLSDSGRLFFDSKDALVPQDVDGTEDAYEYEPAGIGDCTTASTTYSTKSGGCVNLVSSGTSTSESAFLDASETGGDVFFLTTSKLVPKDVDDIYDIYDAHECKSNSPCFLPPPVSPPPCDNGEACKAAQTPQPLLFGAPASATFRGAGNPVSTPPPPAHTGLTRAQKLARALKACGRLAKRKRSACRRRAELRYGKPSSTRSKGAGKRRRRSK